MIDAPVDAIDVAAYTVPTDAPEADGTLSWDSTTMVLVTARSGDTRGLGWTYGPAACAAMITGKLIGVVRGRDAMDVAGAFDAMVKAVRNDGRPGAVGYAISAVDVALWDLKARLLGLPLDRLLGAVRKEVPVYGSGGFTAYDERQLRDQLTHWAVEQRIPRVKIKIGESWGTDTARDLDRMQQARTVVGDDVELFVDANGGYTRKQAIRVMTVAAADFGVNWYEEPVSSDDLDGLREIRDAVSADVTAGEYGYDLYYFRRMRGRRRRLPAGRRVTVRRYHRVDAGGGGRRVVWAAGVRALRAALARPRGLRHAESAAPGMVSRSCADRVDVLRRHPRSRRRHHPARPRRSRQRADSARGRHRAVPGPMSAALRTACRKLTPTSPGVNAQIGAAN